MWNIFPHIGIFITPFTNSYFSEGLKQPASHDITIIHHMAILWSYDGYDGYDRYGGYDGYDGYDGYYWYDGFDGHDRYDGYDGYDG